jgi:cysteine sulfinate desulfinase/cysteine desulfurase-like protein
MQANNEVGTIEPIAEIAEIAHWHDVLIHTDSAQAIGKIPVDVNELQIDLLSIAGHKLYAPKGIGALYIRSGIELEKLIHGANHELNRRAGTENVLEIVGLGKACEIISEESDNLIKHLKPARDRFEEGLRKINPNVRINGHPEKRLPNTCSAGFKNIDADKLLTGLKNVAASAGAACHSDKVQISSVLKAMDVPLEFARGTVRFSTGRFTTLDDIDAALTEIGMALSKLSAS